MNVQVPNIKSSRIFQRINGILLGFVIGIAIMSKLLLLVLVIDSYDQ